jgi:hypothetical protein
MDSVVGEDGVVRIGSVIFALIQPTPGREQAFNRWYERDHYYTAGTAAPGVFSAARFVQPETQTHLALYFVLPGHDEARVAFATEQVGRASTESRMFDDREHLHTWSYEIDVAWRSDQDVVPLALALDRRYPMVSVAMYDTDAGSHGVEPESGLGIDSIVVLRPQYEIMPSTWGGEVDSSRRRVAIAFHRDRSDVEPFAAYAGLVWSSSFLPIVFGTDTHIVD